MAERMTLRIVSPAQEIQHAGIKGVAFDAYEGSMGVLENHADMIGLLGIGAMHFTDKEGNLEYYSISGGFFEVRDNVLLVLADAVERAEEIDVERAKKARERAEKHLKEQAEKTDIDRAQIALLRALNRLKIAGKHT